MESTHIRVHGDRDYWDNVEMLATIHKTSLAAFVKATMDTAHGEQLKRVDELKALFLPFDIAEQQISNKEADHA